MPRIVVVGSSNTDLIVQAPRLPGPGETVLGGDLVRAAGGKGANQAVAAARLGAQVTLVARVGDDSMGRTTVEQLASEGISTHFVVQDRHRPSGAALIVVDERGENLIAVAPGANAALGPQDVEAALQAIRSADVLLLQLEIPLPAVRRAVDLAWEAGVPLILNPAPACPLDESLLQRITLLTPNRSEAACLTGMKVDDQDLARRALDRLLEMGPRSAVLTLGKDGALAASPGEDLLHIPAHPVQAVDATAAGDAFNGGLAFGLGCGWTLERSIQLAAAVAALSVTRLGAQPSLPTWREVEDFRDSRAKPQSRRLAP